MENQRWSKKAYFPIRIRFRDVYKRQELAGLLGIPADELQKTIDRYNELCDKGSDVRCV